MKFWNCSIDAKHIKQVLARCTRLYGVSTKLFTRNIGSAISTIHNNTEVFDFEYYKNASDPTSVDTTNALNKQHLVLRVDYKQYLEFS